MGLKTSFGRFYATNRLALQIAALRPGLEWLLQKKIISKVTRIKMGNQVENDV